MIVLHVKIDFLEAALKATMEQEAQQRGVYCTICMYCLYCVLLLVCIILISTKVMILRYIIFRLFIGMLKRLCRSITSVNKLMHMSLVSDLS